MQKNRHRIVKTVVALVLALVLAGSFSAFVPKQTMAAGGTVTVSLANAEGLSANTEFSFEMYKVGHFSGPGLVLEDNLKGSNADVYFPSDSTESEEAKAERMVKSAEKLTNYIDANGIEPDLVAAFKLTAGGSYSVQVGENALYLVRSHTVRDAESTMYNWTPQSVYVAVLNGDSSIAISNEVVTKIVRTPVALNHQVRKVWDIPENVKDVKPGAVFVNIRYGNKIVDTVKLSEDNSWVYNWSSEEAGDTYKYIGKNDAGEKKEVEFTPGDSDPVWSCDEVLDAQSYADNFSKLAYENATPRQFTAEEIQDIEKAAQSFSPEETVLEAVGTIATTPEEQAAQVSHHEITNVYSKAELEITKRLDGYVDGGDRSNVTTAFKIIAKDKNGNEIYNNTLGISFAKDDEVDAEGYYTKTRKVTGIPGNADEIIVREVYASQYKGDSDKSNKGDNPEIVFNSEKNLWTVTMDNTHDYHQGSGVVNKYSNGDLKDREGNIEHK